jgi:very-short-patch-repair endonuclease
MPQNAPVKEPGEYEWLILEQAGVLTTRQAVDLLGLRTVNGHLAQGRWRRLCRGLVLTHNGRLDAHQQLWVAILTMGDEAHLAGATAMAAGGVTGLKRTSIEVIIPGRRVRSTRAAKLPADMERISLHRTTVFPASHRQVGRPPRTAMPRSVIDAAAWARTDIEARMLIMRACQQRRVTVDGLREALSLFPKVRRRRLISETFDDLDRGATTLCEAGLIALCRRFELPQPELQRHRQDADGRHRYLDAYWPDYRLQVEVDGAHHMDVDQWGADMLRQNQLWIEGDRILRFPSWLVRSRPEIVADQIRAALHVARPASGGAILWT